VNFNEAAIAAIFDKTVSYAAASGYFDSVNAHEPKSAPGNGVTCAVWVDRIAPVRSSGLASTSGLLVLMQRVYTNFISQPFDAIDPNVLSAVSWLIGAYSADFDLGGAGGTRNVDLLGAEGVPLAAQAGYIEIDRKMNRVMTVTIPIVVNDMWSQEVSD
jgi:hypothetical protein